MDFICLDKLTFRISDIKRIRGPYSERLSNQLNLTIDIIFTDGNSQTFYKMVEKNQYKTEIKRFLYFFKYKHKVLIQRNLEYCKKTREGNSMYCIYENLLKELNVKKINLD